MSTPLEQDHIQKANEKHLESQIEKDNMKQNAFDTKEKLETKFDKDSSQTEYSDYVIDNAAENKAKPRKFDQKTFSDSGAGSGSGQNRGIYSNESDKINAGSHYVAPQAPNVSNRSKSANEGLHREGHSEHATTTTHNTHDSQGGMLHSAKETIVSAYNTVAAKIHETAEVAKEKMDHLIHHNDHHNADKNTPVLSNNNPSTTTTTTTPSTSYPYSTATNPSTTTTNPSTTTNTFNDTNTNTYGVNSNTTGVNSNTTTGVNNDSGFGTVNNDQYSTRPPVGNVSNLSSEQNRV